jgi:hypothetical protein
MTWIRLLFAAVAGLAGHKAYGLFQGAGMASEGAIAVLLAAVGVAYMVAPFLIDAVLALRHHGRHAAHGKWQGKYYSFGNRHLRLYLVGGTIWLAVPDLVAILDPVPDEREWRLLGGEFGTVPGQGNLQGCTRSGLAVLLKNRTTHRRATHDMIRFKAWLENEAYPNLLKNPASSA